MYSVGIPGSIKINVTMINFTDCQTVDTQPTFSNNNETYQTEDDRNFEN